MERQRLRENYARELSREVSPLPTEQEIDSAYRWLTSQLPRCSVPSGGEILLDTVDSHELLHFPQTGSIIVAASGNETTSIRQPHQVTVLGYDLYETPDKRSGLNPDIPVPLVRHRKASEELFRRKIVDNALFYYDIAPDKRDEVERYIEEECPMGLLWSTTAVADTLYRMNELTHGQLLDEDGKIRSEYANRVMLINADSGAGEVLAHHDRGQGRIHAHTLTNTLSNESTGFISTLFGINQTKTVIGACASSGIAINLAEMLADSRKNTADIFVIMSAYDGPTPETQEAFDVAGIPKGDRPPYLYNRTYGYTEAPAAVANMFVTRSAAETLSLPLDNARLVQSVSVQGLRVYGIDSKIPKDTLKKGFEMLSSHYSSDYSGTMVFATHGVNTPGWLAEIQALKQLKQEYYPDAHFVITSTQPQMGHPYAPRSSISLEMLVQSAEEGFLPGMVRAKEDMSFVGQESIQELRRTAVTRLTGIEERRSTWNFGAQTAKDNERAEEKARRLHQELESLGITLCFSAMAIPDNTPLISIHTGLNGESALVYALPIR